MIILETERLIVRELEAGDIDALHAITGDPAVVRYVGDGQPLPREGNEKWIAVSQNNYRTKGYGASAIILKANGEFIGYGGIIHAAEHDLQPELIYGFKPAYWGQGLATEFGRAMIEYGFEQHKLPYIIATIDPENTASRHVAEKIGMTHDHTETYDDGESVAWYIVRNAKAGE